ncbi:MAG: cell division protein FtsW [Rhodospirillaceae bacterium]|jgi:cell division protein FtsW|nr:cell division protein FtsW [Rhodospirillaceae bacterium]MBT4589494.1 cell division protein FtsW [Rhodospirillaceae bacterium]MBT4940622.1 cell division protein FtsW [Rhodospirillaceae bacterium]MBT7268236.1 cell division protein FtsW [Rhodospirillaceae bacterium]
MNSTFSRTDESLFGRWWWTVDRWMIAAIIAIAASGAVLALAASPAVAERIGLDTFYFARRQFIVLPFALIVMFAVSLLNRSGVRQVAVICFGLSVILMVYTLLNGDDIKGATRWVTFGGFSIQPSEFVKPSFAIISAWMFAAWRLKEDFPGYMVAVGLYLAVVALLLMQPDVGMAILVSVVWGVQFFLAGLPMLLVLAIGLIFISGGFAAYFNFSHVQMRIDRFFDPASSEAYQVARSLEAFRNGGVFGRGPGEGHVKEVLPDAHADFIFAVAGEEFGLVMTLLIVGLFLFVVLRGFARAFKETDLFVQLAVAGLLVQFGLQAIINMASTLNLMPTKGMTLPLISYGGSSMLALAIGLGMVLALTRERPGQENAWRDLGGKDMGGRLI